MQRNESSQEGDSGWLFKDGSEDQAYLDDPGNVSLMAVNTIANFDTDVLPFLMYPAGSAVERGADGKLSLATPQVPAPAITFAMPVEAGRCPCPVAGR